MSVFSKKQQQKKNEDFRNALVRSLLIAAFIPLVCFLLFIFFGVSNTVGFLLVLAVIVIMILVMQDNLNDLLTGYVKENQEMIEEIDRLNQLIGLKGKNYESLENINYAIDQAALFAIINAGGYVTHISKKFLELLGFQSQQKQVPIESLLTLDEKKQDQLKHLFKMDRQNIWVQEIDLVTHNNNVLWLELSIIPINSKTSKKSFFILANDITKRIKSQEEVDKFRQVEYENQVAFQKNQASLIVEAQEEERKRIAKDIHDGIGQMLTALKFNVESFNLEDLEKSEQKLVALKNIFSQLIKDVRAVTFNLTPPELSDYGIAAAIKKMTDEIAKLSGKNIIFQNETSFQDRFDSLTETNIYRVVQEALNNALKYAQSSYVLVRIKHSKQMLSILIEDDGVGFDSSSNSNSEEGLGMGLFFMQERISYIDGRLFIHSEKGEGTSITINLPIEFD